MTKVKLVQNEGSVSLMINVLTASSSTTLNKVCNENDLNYGEVYRKINANAVDIVWLKELVRLINPEAKINLGFSLQIEVDGKEVFNEKIEE